MAVGQYELLICGGILVLTAVPATIYLIRQQRHYP
jgi:hypothetical protein